MCGVWVCSSCKHEREVFFVRSIYVGITAVPAAKPPSLTFRVDKESMTLAVGMSGSKL